MAAAALRSTSLSCADLLNALEQQRSLRDDDDDDPKGLLPPGCSDRRGRSALSIAAGAGAAPEVLERLAAAGYAVETADQDGLTLLSYAARGGRVASARWLLDRGADAGRCDVFGVAPVHKAAAFGQAAVVAEILRSRAARDVDVDGQRRLLAALPMGTTDHAPAAYGSLSKEEQPLHLVARSTWATTWRQRLETMRVFLDAGATVNAVDADGDTPFHAAAECREANLCRLLLQAGANPQAHDARGEPPAARVPWTVDPILRADLELRAGLLSRRRAW